MKKLLLLSGLMVAALGVYAQGTVNFANGAAGVDAPITNGTVIPNVRADNGFRAQLYVGPAASPSSALSTNGVSGVPATLLAGGGAGYFLGNSRDLTGFAPGSIVTLQVRAWQASSGASWESALNKGESNLIQVTLGGNQIPTPNMVGLQGFVVGGAVIPEPSSIALGLLGLGAIALFRRRK